MAKQLDWHGSDAKRNSKFCARQEVLSYLKLKSGQQTREIVSLSVCYFWKFYFWDSNWLVSGYDVFLLSTIIQENIHILRKQYF